MLRRNKKKTPNQPIEPRKVPPDFWTLKNLILIFLRPKNAPQPTNERVHAHRNGQNCQILLHKHGPGKPPNIESRPIRAGCVAVRRHRARKNDFPSRKTALKTLEQTIIYLSIYLSVEDLLPRLPL